MNFTETRTLGKTGLKVGPLGVASGYGAPTNAFEEAFEKGCNYFYWGSQRRNSMRQAIKNICKQGKREDLIIVIQSYSRSAFLMETFPHLHNDNRPGIVSYTATRWGQLLNPKKMPPGENPPSASHCYRFVLSNPAVDVCMCGPKDTDQMREALRTLQLGPLNEEELKQMREIGDFVNAHTRKFF